MSSKRVILVQGLPGSGKTTLADLLATALGSNKVARINADQVRATISRDLGFSQEAREVQAYRMGRLAVVALETPDLTTYRGLASKCPDLSYLNQTAVVDFICPTARTREVFDSVLSSGSTTPIKRHSVWMNTVQVADCKYPDTARIYEPPVDADLIVNKWHTLPELEGIALSISRYFEGGSYGRLPPGVLTSV